MLVTLTRDALLQHAIIDNVHDQVTFAGPGMRPARGTETEGAREGVNPVRIDTCPGPE